MNSASSGCATTTNATFRCSGSWGVPCCEGNDGILSSFCMLLADHLDIIPCYRAKKLLPSCSSYTRMERWMYIILFYGRKLENEVGGNTVKRMEKRLLLLIAKALVPLCWPFLAFFTRTPFMLPLLQILPLAFQDLH